VRFAMVGVFVSHGQAGIRVVVTGAARNSVFRWTEAEKALLESWSPEVLGGVFLPPEQLNDDIRGTALYGADLAKALPQRAIRQSHVRTRGTSDADAR
jgi:carbon-monoxide dehydrogenase medium subunit